METQEPKIRENNIPYIPPIICPKCGHLIVIWHRPAEYVDQNYFTLEVRCHGEEVWFYAHRDFFVGFEKRIGHWESDLKKLDVRRGRIIKITQDLIIDALIEKVEFHPYLEELIPVEYQERYGEPLHKLPSSPNV